MKNPNKKAKLTAIIALVLMLTSLMSVLPIVYAADRATIAYVSVDPNPIGVDQTMIVNVWLTPSIPNGMSFHGFTVTFTKPDGTKKVIGPFDSEPYGTAAAWFEYIPDQIGTWSYQFNYPGGDNISGTVYAASTSPKLNFTVQKDPIIGVQDNPLPTEYWTRPIYAENHKWGAIAGDWVQAGADAGSSRWNPYSQGPESAHVLWSKNMQMAGIIGGQFGELKYGHGSGTVYARVNLIFYGRTIYRDSNGATHCIDVKTGEEYWVSADMASISGVIFQTGRDPPLEPDMYLVSIGTSYIKYDPWTGAQTYRLNNTLSGTLDASQINPLVYSRSGGRLICWNTSERKITTPPFTFSAAATSFSQLIVYNVTDPGFGISYISNGYGGVISNYPGVSGCINLATGQKLWNRTIPLEERETGAWCAGDGKIYGSGDNMMVRAYDMATGTKVWEAQADYPWGTFWSYSGLSFANGNVIASNYDGLYSFNCKTGARNWVFKTPLSGYYSPYPGWPMWGGAVIADGKIYQSTGEHSPSNPVPQGNRLYCVNETTGELIWSISDLSGSSTGDPKAIADGVLLFANEYDLSMYAIGKGPSATTVSAPQTAITQGQSVMITGTVLDKSPGQPNTPCVSPESMGDWMGYLHMQKPMPANVTGVEISLSAIDPNDNVINIGTVTSDVSGAFGCMWTTPEIAGKYQVMATFKGDASYGSSYAETYVGVVEPPPQTEPTPVVTQVSDNTTILYSVAAAAVAIILAIAIVGALVLRKR
jgi:outer membrane protein assembly factor BamB